jgi:hypothetical protein
VSIDNFLADNFVVFVNPGEVGSNGGSVGFYAVMANSDRLTDYLVVEGGTLRVFIINQ